MGMSTFVYGLRDDDDDYRKKLAAKKACEAAGVKLPQELQDYFGGAWGGNDDDPLRVEIPTHKVEGGEMDEVTEIRIDELPPGVKRIRFVNSW